MKALHALEKREHIGPIIDLNVELYAEELTLAQQAKIAGNEGTYLSHVFAQTVVDLGFLPPNGTKAAVLSGSEPNSGWFVATVVDDCILYANAKTGEVRFAIPEETVETTNYLNTEEIKVCISSYPVLSQFANEDAFRRWSSQRMINGTNKHGRKKRKRQRSYR